MSAIAGLIHFSQEPINLVQTKELMRVFKQFPADDIHMIHTGNLFFGCHAQWITPESVNEKLPYYDYETNLYITSDCIIDNRNELFEKLDVRKEKRALMTDSKLILLAYRKWGEDSPKHLVGDFVFVIWDEIERTLFGARDFSGARTLYFFNDYNRFAFSTTIEPLFSLPYVSKELNEEWLAEFLAIPSMVESVDTLSTVYKDIKQIPPAHSISIKNGKVRISQYCNVVDCKMIKLKSDSEYEEAFREVFERAVKDRLRTFGNVGAQLSGGLDSGSVVSFASKELCKENKRLYTFSYIPSNDFVDWTSKYLIADERPFIKETVNQVGNITDHYLNFEGRNPLTELDEFLDIMEMPYKFFENSFWLMGINEKAQQSGIKVLLNGARGNFSISWGSIMCNLDYYTDLFRNLRWLRLYRELDLYCENFNTGKSTILPVLVKRSLPSITNIFNNDNQDDYRFPSLLHPLLANKTNINEKLANYGVNHTEESSRKPFIGRNEHFAKLYSWNKTGNATTKLSLRYSLWDRDPTNDIRVIRFCLSIPNEQYTKGGLDRSLIRRATRHYLPDMVRLNNKSRGMQSADLIHRMTPTWKAFIDELQQLIRDPIIEDLINIEVIKDLIPKYSEVPQQDFVLKDDFRVLTRALVLYRFIRKTRRKGVI